MGSEGRVCCVPESQRNCTLQRDSVSSAHQPDSKLRQRAGAYRVRSSSLFTSLLFLERQSSGHKTLLSCNDSVFLKKSCFSDNWIWQMRLALYVILLFNVHSLSFLFLSPRLHLSLMLSNLV